ncbi:MAG: sugar phosphate isomerase/epimerase [Lentisphaerae bacterium]|nr:MAG: sugar phosphate isomerase/epimerase [Lentisphaerota bacterium]
MYTGLLTARFPREKDIREIIIWAGENNFSALEIASHHIDMEKIAREGAAELRDLLEQYKLKVSSIAHYKPVFRPDVDTQQYIAQMKTAFKAAQALGTDVVCTLAGFPYEGKSKEATIREELPAIFMPLAEEAASMGIKIAFENWFATNLQGVHHFRALIESLPAANIGFNFDPSHFYWQGIDYIAAIYEFGERIFHTHAKDCAVREDLRRVLGVLERGWWRYVIPGFGDLAWGRIIGALREVKFDGVLSIEHEDRAFDAETGFNCGRRYLQSLL